MGSAGPIAQLLGGAVGAYGDIFQGDAQANAYKYNAAVASQNAQVAQENARLAGESGTATAAAVSLRNMQNMGQIKAQQGASGLDVNSGSAVDVRASAKELGTLDAYNARVQAVREAYGYETQAHNYEAEATLDQYQADISQEASYFNAAGTMLGAASNAANSYTSWMMETGGFGG